MGEGPPFEADVVVTYRGVTPMDIKRILSAASKPGIPYSLTVDNRWAPREQDILAENRREFIAAMEAEGATFTPLGHRENCARQLHGHEGPCSL